MIGAVIFFAAIGALFYFGSDGSWRDEVFSRVVAPAITVAAFPVLFLINLFRAPGEIYQSVAGRLDHIEAAIKPRIELEDPTTEDLPVGQTLLMASGNFRNAVEQVETLIRITARNASMVETIRARVYLNELCEENESGKLVGIGFRESQPLTWTRTWRPRYKPETDRPAVFEKEIPPGGTAHVYLAKQFWGQDAILMMEDQPLESSLPFDKSKKYVAKVTATSGSSLPSFISLSIWFDEKGGIQVAERKNGAMIVGPHTRNFPSQRLDASVEKMIAWRDAKKSGG